MRAEQTIPRAMHLDGFPQRAAVSLPATRERAPEIGGRMPLPKTPSDRVRFCRRTQDTGNQSLQQQAVAHWSFL